MESVITIAEEQEQLIKQYLDNVLGDFILQKQQIINQQDFDMAVNRLIDTIFETFKSKYQRIKDHGIYKTIFLNVIRAKQDELFSRGDFMTVFSEVNSVNGILDSTQTYFDAILAFADRYERTDCVEVIKYLVQLHASLCVYHKVNRFYKELGGKTTTTPAPVIEDIHAKTQYYQTLKWISDAGRNLERYPGLYRGKDEENLRFQILSMIESHLEKGSIIAEAMNRSGKTDIQIRDGSSVLFIAECKFWAGERVFHETINQLLSYLTWRDTNTAIVFFVRQKEFRSILQKIVAQAELHPNFLKHLNNADENWFNFCFHLDTDIDCEIQVAVQLFHLP